MFTAGGNPASLRPGRCLDLYSGTKSVGIEAISKGCSEAHFVEMDPWVISEFLRPNLEWTEFLDASVIHTLRVETFLERADIFYMLLLLGVVVAAAMDLLLPVAGGVVAGCLFAAVAGC
ncbi:hypothetical protein IFM89_008043 [Coptis chinensis]|uniref:Uncharacterized protein n=1 Tax=Coptis chinensis TaxID=261450 RepID=A0A835LVA0_9MAGN|nr:hypothetical protein IFM89_008043 [Coptis chinensis]